MEGKTPGVGRTLHARWRSPGRFGEVIIGRQGRPCLVNGGAGGKEPACQCRKCKRHGFDLWFRKILWRRAWLPTPVFLPGESHGQRSLVGYSPWGHKELDTTERLGPAQHSTLSMNSNQVKSSDEVRERREGTVLSVEEPLQDAPRPQAL